MNKLKIIFNQTLMISTGILFCIGVAHAIRYLSIGPYEVKWEWYIPLSIILTGFLCSLPTVLLLTMDQQKGIQLWTRIILHFICIGLIVILCGYLFKWYVSLEESIPILVMYILIYIFVWIASYWMSKSDEKKINTILQNLRDDE